MKTTSFSLIVLTLLTLAPVAHAATICEQPMDVICKETQQLRDKRKKYVDGLKQKIRDEAEARVKERMALEHSSNFLSKIYRGILLRNQEILTASRAMMSSFNQDIVSPEIVATVKDYFEEAINDSSFDQATKVKFISKMRKVTVGNFSDYMDKIGANTNLMSQLFSSHCGLDGLVENAFATKVQGKDYVLICPGWLISLNGTNSKQELFNSILQVLAHEIGHHIDSRNFKDEFGPLASCVHKHYTPSFGQKKEQAKKCLEAYTACLKPGILDLIAGHSARYKCMGYVKETCDQQTTDSHMGELSADTWASNILAIHMKSQGLSVQESSEIVVQNMMKLCGTRDEGSHTSGDFRIKETVMGHPGIREALACKPKKAAYCQI